MPFEQHQGQCSRGMRPLRGLMVLGFAAIATLASAQATAPQADRIRNVVLASDTFDIPFNVGQAGIRPAEVRLYVAKLDERNPKSNIRAEPQWTLLQRQSPDAGHFRLTDVPDGTFWYATETIAPSQVGKIPANLPLSVQPGLRVIVDTTQPDVQLNVDADSDGHVTASFEVRDATSTKPKSLHYATDTTRQWMALPIEPTTTGGRFEIRASDHWKQMELRLSVVDAAGNETLVKKMVKKPRVAGVGSTRFASGPPAIPSPPSPVEIDGDFGRPQPASTMFGNPEFIPTPQPSSVPERSGIPESATPSAPQTAAEAMRPLESFQDDPPQVPDIANDAARQDPGTAMPSTTDQIVPETPFQTSSPKEELSLVSPNRSGEAGQADRPGSREQPGSTNGWSALPRSSQRPTLAPTPSESRQPQLRPMDPRLSERREQRRPSSLDLSELARRSPIRYSDSNQFSLDYEIESIGSRGVDEVELYGTLDGGQTWRLWGSDPDQTTPFDIETAGEGTFGFSIVVFAANGLASPRPQPGDSPDIVVVVDETAPEVAITGARYGEGDRSGSLVVRYQCTDTNLKTRPIALAFGESLEGPWTTIAAGLRNLGDHVWPADSQLPRQIYLRLDATDEAGNVGTYILDKPVDTRGLAPRARIRAFRPISSSLQ